MARGACHLSSEAMIKTTQSTAVPRNVARNTGFGIVTSIDCMAAIPAGAGIRASAFITAVEKAKKIPAISPQPSAAKRVEANSRASIVTKGKAPEDRRRRFDMNGFDINGFDINGCDMAGLPCTADIQMDRKRPRCLIVVCTQLPFLLAPSGEVNPRVDIASLRRHSPQSDSNILTGLEENQ